MKPKLLFVYDLPEGYYWQDGLWAGLKLLEEDFDITRLNLQKETEPIGEWDFALGWGGFDSAVDHWLSGGTGHKRGLCLAANFPVNETAKNYDVIFAETQYTLKWLQSEGLRNVHHAFGVNTDIYFNMGMPKVFDYINVGAWTAWKRTGKLFDKKGLNIALGYLQSERMQESLSLSLSAMINGWIVSNAVPSDKLAELYNLSYKCYIPNDFGGERAVLEARACGVPVEVEDDNPKLRELLTSPIWDHVYYASQLKKGILECL